MAMNMAGSAGGGGGRRGRRRAAVMAEINVTPMVDVMLVLLIIFMVAAPMLQRGVEVNLPVASRSQEIASERLFVSVPLSFRKDSRVYLGEEPLRLEVLAERLRQAMLNRRDKQVFLRGDGGIQYQELMTIIDALKNAGVQQVGLVTSLPGEQ